MANSIKTADVIRQLKADLIGKDSYRGVTLTYSWLANQFGHIALGFIPVIILYRFLPTRMQHANVWCAVIISGTWLLFETYNFLGPLLLNRQSRSKVLFLPKKKYSFSPDWKNIAFDTATDLLFFWLGAFSAALTCRSSLLVLGIMLLLAILIFSYPAVYWYKTKMYLQLARYPFQFRLSQWDLEIDEKNKAIVNSFLNKNNSGYHLLVFGSEGSGKTSLCVGVATELSIRHCDCTYTTGTRLYSLFFDTGTPGDPSSLWTWRNSHCLIIDDINPGDPIKDIISPEIFLYFLDTFQNNPANREVFRKTNMIWVLGTGGSENKLVAAWQEMLTRIGIQPDKISVVDLGVPVK